MDKFRKELARIISQDGWVDDLEVDVDTQVQRVVLLVEKYYTPKQIDTSGELLAVLISIINPREKATTDRVRKLNARLREYTEEEIIKAAKAFSKSDWHKENKQMSIDNLLAPSKFGRWYAASQEESKRKFA